MVNDVKLTNKYFLFNWLGVLNIRKPNKSKRKMFLKWFVASDDFRNEQLKPIKLNQSRNATNNYEVIFNINTRTTEQREIML